MFLKSENVENQKICNVVEKDFRYAKVLDSFGINFYKHPNLTINQICNIRGIDTSSLLGYRLSLEESFELDFDTLKTLMLDCGVEAIHQWNPRRTLHSNFWDFSQAVTNEIPEKRPKKGTISIFLHNAIAPFFSLSDLSLFSGMYSEV